MTEMDETLDVRISALADLAVELWRLQRWAFASGSEKDRSPARHTVRMLGSFFTELEFELRDLTGQPYDPGLAVEVIDVERESGSLSDSVTVGETLAPIVFWRGRMIRTGRIILRVGAATDQEVLN